MKIMVCVKWIGALGDDVEFIEDERRVDPDYLDYSLNEWDAYAVEEALKLRDAIGGEIIAVTVGGEDAERALVQCLAMGVDRAVRVASDGASLDSLTVGRLLAAAIRPEKPDLVLCGAQSSDAAHGATGSALAAFLGFPCATVVTKIEHNRAAGTAIVERELEGGVVDVVKIGLPAVLTIQTGLNKPRYVTLRAVQQAQKLAIEVIDAGDDVSGAPGYHIRRMYVPSGARAELIAGDARAVAARVAGLIREATA